MTLYLYNTLTRAKEAFAPLTPDRVGMYVCGPTVYDLAHIGNARPVVVFDVLYRLLKRRFKHVTYVRNITDVDDKINAAAKAEGVPIDVITARTIRAYHEDMAALGALTPDVEPRATQHVGQMIAMIARLIDRHGQARVALPATLVAVLGGLSLILCVRAGAPDWTLFAAYAATATTPAGWPPMTR